MTEKKEARKKQFNIKLTKTEWGELIKKSEECGITPTEYYRTVFSIGEAEMQGHDFKTYVKTWVYWRGKAPSHAFVKKVREKFK